MTLIVMIDEDKRAGLQGTQMTLIVMIDNDKFLMINS
jgi:hypothetical protein